MKPAAVLIALLAAIAALAAQDVPRPANGPERFTMRVVTSGLAAPWAIAWGPDEQLWLTERRGRRVVRVNPAEGTRTVLAEIADVHQSVTQDGLLGLALHPELLRGTGNDYVYVSYTYDADPGADVSRRLAIRRFRYDSASRALVAPSDVLTGLPAHNDHVAGRLAFGPDGKLYLSIGDQGSNFGQNRCNVNRAQELPTAADVRAANWSRYQGKILRVNLDGSIPADNPALDGVRSHIFSYGHRNPLGLAFASGGRLYSSEHGPSSDDELNLIEGGKNYGWPHVAGFRDDRAYAYGNWSASSPEPCSTLLKVAADRIPPSVPTERETAWSHPAFAAPLIAFYTVDTGYDFQRGGNATMAPGGLAYYDVRNGIPGWNNSLLAASLLRGAVFRVPLRGDGREIAGAPLAYFTSTNRYRDIAIHPDGRRVFLATDDEGRTTDRSGALTRSLENPGAVVEFTFSPGA